MSIDEVTAADVLGQRRGLEHRFSTLRKTPVGRRQVIDVLTSSHLSGATVKIAVMHKRFAAVAKFVDLILEPVFDRLDLDLYVSGSHLVLASFLYAVGRARSPLGLDAMLRAFVGWNRSQNALTARHLAQSIRMLLQIVPEGPVTMAAKIAAAGLEQDPTVFGGGAGGFSDLDPAGPSLMALLHDWSHELGPFDVLHDDSKEIAKILPVVVHYASESIEPIDVVLANGAELHYPLAMRAIELGSSKASARLQLADVIAGAARVAHEVHVDGYKGSERAFGEAILETPLEEWRTGASIWPDLSGSAPARSDATASLIDVLAGIAPDP